MALSIETYVPELDNWVEEATLKYGEKPRYIKQNYHPERRRPFYYQLRVFPKSAMIEIIEFEDEIETNGTLFATVHNSVMEDPQMFANLKRGQEHVTELIQTDFDTKPQLYRFKFS